MSRMIGLVVGLIVLMGCASRFAKISPGMKKEEVNKIMKKGPSEAKTYESDYAAWYYGEDQCLLFKGDEVVQKAVTKEKGLLSVGGWGGISAVKKAECAPPGQESRTVEKTIQTPFGSVRR